MDFILVAILSAATPQSRVSSSLHQSLWETVLDAPLSVCPDMLETLWYRSLAHYNPTPRQSVGKLFYLLLLFASLVRSLEDILQLALLLILYNLLAPILPRLQKHKVS